MIAPPSSQPPSRTHEESEDSDSDWDDDDDFVAKKINIRIKPVAELTASDKISPSADELRASMGTWKSMANINLVKPNSRRSMHQSTIVLNKMSNDSNNELTKHHSTHINREGSNTDFMQPSPPSYESPMFSQPPVAQELKPIAVAPLVMPQAQSTQVRLPVAIAAQECLHVRISSTGDVESNLVGHIKMAVPRNITKFSQEHFRDNNLLLQISASSRWSSIRGNQTFIKSVQEIPESGHGCFGTKLLLNMESIYEYANRLINHNERSYFLLPELATYTLQSRVSLPQEINDENQLTRNFSDVQQHISLVRATSHWLCDSNTTKVRTDIEYLAESLEKSGIHPCDIRNITVSMQVDGDVISHQSKPQASWDPIHSQLSWSFATLQELLELSGNYRIASCLAKLVLSQGPSKPSETRLQFSISEKTISNVQVSLPKGLNHQLTYTLTKFKQEVSTGSFECEPQV